MERYQEIVSRLMALCNAQEDIKAVIAIGSQCRAYKKADEYSDLDLIIACDLPEKFLYEDDWMVKLGEIQYSFVENTLAGQKERRILFRGSLDVDFIVVKTQFLQEALKNHRIDGIMSRGYRVLFDSMDIRSLVETIPVLDHVISKTPSETEFRNLVNDFYYHTVWAEKKILRGEIWTAKMCIDAYLKNLLLKMIEIYEMCLYGTDYDVWHNGRMLEQWADDDIVQELGRCFAHYNTDDMKKALEHTISLFTRLAKVCAEKYNYITGIDLIDPN